VGFLLEHDLLGVRLLEGVRVELFLAGDREVREGFAVAEVAGVNVSIHRG
jgi:hypothetical protein